MFAPPVMCREEVDLEGRVYFEAWSTAYPSHRARSYLSESDAIREVQMMDADRDEMVGLKR